MADVEIEVGSEMRLNIIRQQVAVVNGHTVAHNVEYHYCGPINIKCQFCKALHFEVEKPSDGKLP